MIYEYQCEAGHRSELRFKMGEAPDAVPCPELPAHLLAGDFPLIDKSCGRPASRVFSPPALLIYKVMYPPSQRYKPARRDL